MKVIPFYLCSELNKEKQKKKWMRNWWRSTCDDYGTGSSEYVQISFMAVCVVSVHACRFLFYYWLFMHFLIDSELSSDQTLWSLLFLISYTSYFLLLYLCSHITNSCFVLKKIINFSWFQVDTLCSFNFGGSCYKLQILNFNSF